MIKELMKKHNMSVYRLSKMSKIPYSTVNDICTGKRSPEKCSAETVYKLSEALGVSMEELLEPYMFPRCGFDLFKSNVCHALKEKGDIGFIIETLEHDDINTYYRMEWYAESFYLLGMLDYISRENNIPVCSEYEKMRSESLEEPLYPSGVIAQCAAAGNTQAKEQALKEAIPEFLRFNIIESDVRNVT